MIKEYIKLIMFINRKGFIFLFGKKIFFKKFYIKKYIRKYLLFNYLLQFFDWYFLSGMLLIYNLFEIGEM